MVKESGDWRLDISTGLEAEIVLPVCLMVMQVTSILTFAASCAFAGITVLIRNDLGDCASGYGFPVVNSGKILQQENRNGGENRRIHTRAKNRRIHTSVKKGELWMMILQIQLE
ncbi:hypothetical protein ACS0TY_006370 [Phlomoides rotata]